MAKRTPFQRENDLVELSRLYLQGKTQAYIAAKLGVSAMQISYDLKDVRERWRKQMVRSFDDAISEQLARIDLLETEAWEALARSREDKIVASNVNTEGKMVKGNVDYSRQSVRKEKQNSDISYMNLIDKCIERRCRLLGLNPPERVEADIRTHNTNVNINADLDLSAMTNDEINAAIRNAESQMTALNSVGKPLDFIEGTFTTEPLPTLPALPEPTG